MSMGQFHKHLPDGTDVGLMTVTGQEEALIAEIKKLPDCARRDELFCQLGKLTAAQAATAATAKYLDLRDGRDALAHAERILDRDYGDSDLADEAKVVCRAYLRRGNILLIADEIVRRSADESLQCIWSDVRKLA